MLASSNSFDWLLLIVGDDVNVDFKTSVRTGLVAAALAMTAGTAFADGVEKAAAPAASAAKPDLQITGNVAGTTNYVFRGFSQSAQNPAVQGGVDVTYKLFYAGLWASTIDFGRDGGNPNSAGRDIAHREVDYYFGIKPVLGPVTFDVGMIAYTYPGAFDGHGATLNQNIDYYEFKAGGSVTPWKDATVGLTAFYSPSYFNGTGAVTTIEGALSQTLAKIGPMVPTLGGTLGYQTGNSDRYRQLYLNFESDNFVYWNAGVTLGFGDNFSLDLRYWDTNLKDNNVAGGGVANFCTGAIYRCDERFVATAKVTF